jgi:flap endonuclease-1
VSYLEDIKRKMGLSVKDIIPRKEIEFSELKGKLVCVDAYNMLYQFLSTIRQPDGTPLMDDKKRVTSHLSGIFYRNVNLLSEGLKLVYVFDGEPPGLKAGTHKNRSEGRDLAKSRYAQAKQSEDLEAMRRYSSQLVRIDDDMLRESKELLEAMGVAVVQAPGEGEAEAAYLSKTKNEVYAAVSQDYDCLLFGAPKLVRNLAMSRRRKTFSGWVEVKPELIELRRVLDILEINLDQLICLGILVGTDYNPKGIPGIGQKRALELVRKYRQPVLIFKSVEEQMMSMPEEDRFDWQEIFELFHKPNVSKTDFKFGKVDEEKIKKILVEEHDFSLDRVEKQLDKLRDLEDKKKQKNLGDWT